MSKPIIEVTNLGKKYTKTGNLPYYSFRDSISGIFSKRQKSTKDEFWALKDINFKINRGESVGIIGRNGAGKSTLLKILSQITPLTTGKITMRGRVASLLEVGTGFHQELTGRENIYLNGAILGMSRVEINRKFNDIVEFAEIGDFLDMQVKHYSSGMYMRLAFAVAAHLESEILIVDEVLAVGDAEFQKKCLGKMDEVAKKEGRTVLFVSHNMGVVNQICKKSFLLESGKLIASGETGKVIGFYLSSKGNKAMRLVSRGPEIKFENFRINGLSIAESPRIKIIETGIRINFDYFVADSSLSVDSCFAVGIRKVNSGEMVAYNHNHLDKYKMVLKNKGKILVDYDIKNLSPGDYHIEFSFWVDSHVKFVERGIGSFTIDPVAYFKQGGIIEKYPATLMLAGMWSNT